MTTQANATSTPTNTSESTATTTASLREHGSAIIARWWANKLRKVPKGIEQFEGAGYFKGSVETAVAGAMGGFLVDKILEREGDVPEEVAEAFELRLRDLVLEALSRTTWDVSLSTDYHPCRMLQKAAEGLDIKALDLRLPWKTYTRVGDEFVSVGHGDEGLLWATKRERVRRAAMKLLELWENHDRVPPRWQVNGRVSADSYEHVEGWTWDANRLEYDALDREHVMLRAALEHRFEELAIEPEGEVRDIAVTYVSIVLAIAGLAPLAKAVHEAAKVPA